LKECWAIPVSERRHLWGLYRVVIMLILFILPPHHQVLTAFFENLTDKILKKLLIGLNLKKPLKIHQFIQSLIYGHLTKTQSALSPLFTIHSCLQ
jgi:hypothetical protein